jgi:hypothetical protein
VVAPAAGLGATSVTAPPPLCGAFGGFGAFGPGVATAGAATTLASASPSAMVMIVLRIYLNSFRWLPNEERIAPAFG